MFGKLRLFSRFSGPEPRSSNSIPDSLHRDATCTYPCCCLSILSRLGPSTKCRYATVTTMYWSSCCVVTFGRPDLGRSETVSIAGWESQTQTMVLRWMFNRLATSCGWKPSSIRHRAGSLSSSESFLKALKGLAFYHNIIDNSNAILVKLRCVLFNKKNHAKNAVGYVIG